MKGRRENPRKEETWQFFCTENFTSLCKWLIFWVQLHVKLLLYLLYSWSQTCEHEAVNAFINVWWSGSMWRTSVLTLHQCYWIKHLASHVTSTSHEGFRTDQITNG